MKSIKLSQEKKEAIKDKLLNEAFGARFDDLEARKLAFNEKIYEDIYKGKKKDMEALPDGWLPECDEFKVQFEGGVYGGVCQPQLKEKRRFLSKHYHKSQYDRPILKIYSSSDEIYKLHEKFTKEKEDLDEEYREAKLAIKPILMSVNTTMQLIEMWPESKAIVEELFDDELPGASFRLPAVQMDKVNNLLKLSKKQLNPT